MKKDKVTLQKTSQNLVRVNNYFESAVAKVKEQYDLKDASTRNDPPDTISRIHNALSGF